MHDIDWSPSGRHLRPDRGCPNLDQWHALLIGALAFGVLTLITVGMVVKQRHPRAILGPPPRPLLVAALVIAVAVIIVDPVGHIGGSGATWLGERLSDGSLE